MNKRKAFLITRDELKTETAEGEGVVVCHPRSSSGIANASILGNTVLSAPGAIYPERCDFIHAGDITADSSGKEKYRFDARIHGKSWLGADELKRICNEKYPGLIEAEDDGFIYLRSSSEYDGAEIISPSDAVFLPQVYTVTVSALSPDDYAAYTMFLNLALHYEGTAKLYLSVSGNETGLRTMRRETSSDKTPSSLFYVYKYTHANQIAIKKDSLAIFPFADTEWEGEVPPYVGVSRSILLDEPLRSLTDTDGSVYADEYSLTEGKITRRVAECTVDGSGHLYSMTIGKQLMFYVYISTAPGRVGSGILSSCFSPVKNPNALIGTTLSHALSDTGYHIFFTLTSEYTSIDEAKQFLRENPVSFLYVLQTEKTEDAERLISQHDAGYAVLEAAAENRPRVKIEYAV